MKFVERRSLLSAEHGYFANIYTQKGPSMGRGQKTLTKGVEGEAGEAFTPLVIQLNRPCSMLLKHELENATALCSRLFVAMHPDGCPDV